MESARRWSGYVCPDCRFVFRVARNHDGRGIVCPSCRRMLRIPAADDTPLPLMASLRRVSGAEPAAEDESRGMKLRRRSRRGAGSENHSWEQQPHLSHSGGMEKWQLRLILISGVSIFILMIGAAFYSMSSHERFPLQPTKKTETPAQETVIPQAASVPAVIKRGEAMILAEAAPLAREFLEAKTVNELLPLVRDRTKTESRIRAFYQDGVVEALGLSKFNPRASAVTKGKQMSVGVTTRDFDERSIVFIDTPEGLKIDWESWVGWSEMPWSEFLAEKPSAGLAFRVTLSLVEYYNFAFADESKWQSYRLESPDQKHSIYGYVKKDSLLNEKIRLNQDIKRKALMLSLKFPPGAADGSQVEIERIITEGWVEEVAP